MTEPVSFEAGKAMWNVSAERGLNLSRGDILALLQAAEPHIRHRPQREDAVATWLKKRRDQNPRDPQAWFALDNALDDYRLHADTGTPLTQPVLEQ